MTIEIDNRLYNDIVQLCETNGLEPLKYIEKALRERVATDKYGDLNQKIEERTIEEKKDGQPQEKPVEQIHVVQYENNGTENEEVIVDEPYVEADITDKVEEKKKTKRTLKTK